MKKITIILFLIIQTITKAQEIIKHNKTIEISGQIGVSYSKFQSKNQLFVNFGGPSIKTTIKNKSIAISMYPSLKYEFETTRLTPMLGVGLQISHKKIILLTPCYYIPTQNVWLGTIGLGYKFK